MRAHAKPVIVHPENCNGCNICNHFCPTVATGFNAQTGKVFVEYQRCIGCGVCPHRCPACGAEDYELLHGRELTIKDMGFTEE